jgi:hypothetical protein
MRSCSFGISSSRTGAYHRGWLNQFKAGAAGVIMLALKKPLRKLTPVRDSVRLALGFGVVSILASLLGGQTSVPSSDPPFPNTAELMAQVAQDQKKIESLLSQYTFTDKTTVYALGKNGNVRSQHTDTYYLTPTAYEFFSLHVSHDGNAVSQKNLDVQQKKIEKQMKEDERKAQRNETIHPKSQMIFSDIIAQSTFTPLRWEQRDGLNTIVYSFEPKSTSGPRGNLTERIARDLRGKMWISPDEKEIVRIEFSSVSSLSLGLLGNVKGFQGFTEQRKFHGELWMPITQEYVAEGRELFKRFRIREVDEFSDYLKATTDVFQQIHTPNANAGDTTNEPR